MWALAATLFVALAIVVTLPLIASTQIVRTRIAQELSDWSGYRVSLGAAPEIEVWPSFRTVLNDVSFWNRTEAGRPAVLQADRVEVDLSVWSAVVGDIAFYKVMLIRPILRVAHQGDFLYLPSSPGGGRLHDALNALTTGSRPQDEAFGTIGFSEGKIVHAEGDVSQDILSSVAGTVAWPGMSRPAAVNATGIWRGEPIAIALFLEAPASLLAGASAPVNVSFQAAPLTLTFNGSAQLAERTRLNGALAWSSPSLRRTLEWSEAQITPGAAIGAVSVKGRLDGGMDRMKVENAEISLGGNAGVGALEVTLAGAVPSISGTLAFDTLDIGSFLSAFAAPGTTDGTEPRMFDLSFSDQINLDLRLSAARATGGPASLTDIAATAQVRRGLAAFDISDATAFGGSVQAGFRVDRKPEGDVGEMRISATDVDVGAVAAAAGWKKSAPKARGSLSAVVKSPVAAWSALPMTISGTLNGKLGAGSIDGIDLAALLRHDPGKGFLALSEISGGSIGFERAEFKATLLGGAARLDIASAQTAKELLTLAGIVSYAGRSLALSATVAPRASGSNGTPDDLRHFFVGGSWNAPYLTPSLPIWAPE